MNAIRRPAPPRGGAAGTFFRVGAAEVPADRERIDGRAYPPQPAGRGRRSTSSTLDLDIAAGRGRQYRPLHVR
jgi:hypothetical protein